MAEGATLMAASLSSINRGTICDSERLVGLLFCGRSILPRPSGPKMTSPLPISPNEAIMPVPAPPAPNIFAFSFSISSTSLPPTLTHSARPRSRARLTIRSIRSASRTFSSCSASTLPHSVVIFAIALASFGARCSVGRGVPGGNGNGNGLDDDGVVGAEEEAAPVITDRACFVRP